MTLSYWGRDQELWRQAWSGHERVLGYGQESRNAACEPAKRGSKELAQVHAATKLDDLRQPPRNKLEKLVGDRKGQHSIRINDQYRVCFVWEDGDTYDVEITDYH